MWNTRTTDPGTICAHNLKEPGYVWLGLVLGSVSVLCNLFMHVGTSTLNTIVCVKLGSTPRLWFMIDTMNTHIWTWRLCCASVCLWTANWCHDKAWDVSCILWASWWVYQPIAYGTWLDVVQVRISQYWIEYFVIYLWTGRQSEWQHSELLCYVVKEALMPYICWVDNVVK